MARFDTVFTQVLKRIDVLLCMTMLACAVCTSGAAAQGSAAMVSVPAPMVGERLAQVSPQASPQAQTRATTGGKVVPLDRVIAVVNDDALTQFDLDDQKRVVLRQMKEQ